MALVITGCLREFMIYLVHCIAITEAGWPHNFQLMLGKACGFSFESYD